MTNIELSSPAWLFAAIPLVMLALTVTSLRKRRRHEIAYFTGSSVLDTISVTRRRNILPGFLRIVGATLLLVGLAGPVLPVLLDQQRANVILLIDISGSMTATDVQPSRLAAAQDAATKFVQSMPEGWKAGLVAFAEQPVVVTPPTLNRADVVTGLASLTALGGTGTGDAISTAVNVGRAGSAERVAEAMAVGDALENPSRTVVVMLSDGRPTAGNETAEAAAYRAQRLGVPVFSIAFGTDAGAITILDAGGQEQRLDVPPDPGTMQQVASITGGGYFTAVTSAELAQVYSSVNARLEAESATLEPGNLLIAAGAMLLAAAAVTAARRAVMP